MTPARLAEIHARAFVENRPWTEVEFAGLLAAADTLLRTSGAAFVLGRVTADEAEILSVATDPDHRRQGHAGAALEAFHRAAAARGACTVYLEVADTNAPARALYASAGYEEAGRRRGYYRAASGARCDALIFRKSLNGREPHVT